MSLSAIDIEIMKASLDGIVQEMQNSLFRTGFSTIVRESQDASCAIMNPAGHVVAQHVVLPLHIGSFPLYLLFRPIQKHLYKYLDTKYQLRQGLFLLIKQNFQ